ncbi:hypothetical protein CLOM_g12828 [Closterium sp. NIES-68]|nr:hypothetical protein CLOM_g12828 [Closterium sp. NIES-68]
MGDRDEHPQSQRTGAATAAAAAAEATAAAAAAAVATTTAAAAVVAVEEGTGEGTPGEGRPARTAQEGHQSQKTPQPGPRTEGG